MDLRHIDTKKTKKDYFNACVILLTSTESQLGTCVGLTIFHRAHNMAMKFRFQGQGHSANALKSPKFIFKDVGNISLDQTYLQCSFIYGSPLVPKQDMYYHEKRCIFQLLRCIIPIWRHLENEMYISTREMYISIWRPSDISGGRQIRIIHLSS